MTNIGALDLVHLTPLMELSAGNPRVAMGLIDGPVALRHPDLATNHLREIPGTVSASCTQTGSIACAHGTFVAGVLSAKRGCAAPGICPEVTLLLRPIFAESQPIDAQMPSATPTELAAAITDCVDAGVRAINLSAGLIQSSKGELKLEAALDYCLKRNVIIVAASGNHGGIGSSSITRHHCVIPVVGYDMSKRPMNEANTGRSIGLRGIGAPGRGITSLGTTTKTLTLSGTSAAAPFVTGVIALLWSIFPEATTTELRAVLRQSVSARRYTLMPPLMDAWAAYKLMLTSRGKR
jgi:subtilisin family serine protease